MNLFLVIYFIFVSVADPMLDGFAKETSSHHEETKTEYVDKSNIADVSISDTNEQHSHNHCPKSCSDHSCHLGHCGFVIPKTSLVTVASHRISYPELDQSIPISHVFGLKRPPRNIA